MALIVVLGMLTVITILAVAFAIAMRFEQLTAKHYADEVRARHFLDVAIVRAMEGVNSAMESQPGGFPYPFWGEYAPASFNHAYVSRGAGPDTEPFVGSVTNMLPASLWGDIANTQPRWLYVVGQDPDSGTLTATNGRIAFLVVNVSGLIDANTCTGGTNAMDRFAPGVVDFTPLTEVAAPTLFLDDREEHRRYETPAELAALNAGIIPPLSNLFAYSYDPGPDRFVVSTNDYGQRGIVLTNKFAVNVLSNYAVYADAAFSNDYFNPLVEQLRTAGITNPLAAAWNVVNFLDADRRPDTGTPMPWREDFGSEALPLINELVLYRVPNPSPPHTDDYGIAVEVWYPFVPRPLRAAEGYMLQVAVFSNFVAGVSVDEIMDHGNPAWSFESPIPDMVAEDASAFFVVGWPRPASAQPIAFPVEVTTPGIGVNPPATRTRFLPIGIATYSTYDAARGAMVDVARTNRVWVLARIVDAAGAPVDESMGYDPADEEGGPRALCEFRAEAVYAVDDPRRNGRTTDWIAATNTLGTTNAIATFNADAHTQGLPIYHRDGLISNLVDVGQVYLAEAGPWHTIDLLDAVDGQAVLLDRLTTAAADTNAPWQRGLVNPNSRHPAVLAAVLGPPELEQPGTLATNVYAIDPEAFDAVAETMMTQDEWPYRDFAAMFGGTPDGGALAAALRACAPSNRVATTDYQREYLLRALAPKVSFRENLLALIVAADALSPDGVAVMARRRAIALVCRDAYTGNWFIKQFLELTD